MTNSNKLRKHLRDVLVVIFSVGIASKGECVDNFDEEGFVVILGNRRTAKDEDDGIGRIGYRARSTIAPNLSTAGDVVAAQKLGVVGIEVRGSLGLRVLDGDAVGVPEFKETEAEEGRPDSNLYDGDHQSIVRAHPIVVSGW